MQEPIEQMREATMENLEDQGYDDTGIDRPRMLPADNAVSQARRILPWSPDRVSRKHTSDVVSSTGQRKLPKVERQIQVNEYGPEPDSPPQSQDKHNVSFTSDGSSLINQPSIFSPSGGSSIGTSANTSFRSEGKISYPFLGEQRPMSTRTDIPFRNERKVSDSFAEYRRDIEDWVLGDTFLEDDTG